MVYKGCERRMIVLKKPEGDYFDEAYFILKDGYAKNKAVSEENMVKEANRILSKYSLISEKKKRKNGKQIPVLSFLLGVTSGICLFYLINMLAS